MENFRTTKLAAGIILLASVFAGCRLSLPEPKEAREYYVLRALPSDVSAQAAPLPLKLTLANTGATPFLMGRKIIFSESPDTRGYYQFSSWVEPPPDAISRMLLDKISAANIYGSVAREGTATAADLRLTTELTHFYQDLSRSPSEVEVSLTAELIDLSQRELIARKEFKLREKVKDLNVAAAVEAFDSALNKLLDQIVAWLPEVSSKALKTARGR